LKEGKLHDSASLPRDRETCQPRNYFEEISIKGMTTLVELTDLTVDIVSSCTL
jgi:hypothetical protein